MHIALFEPQIPPNTGNVIRLCANTGAQLHLIHPLGFLWKDKQLRRAGLDYIEFAQIIHHENWQSFCQYRQQQLPQSQLWALTTKGQKNAYSVHFQSEDILLFGSETKGLPPEIHQELRTEQKIRLPMRAHSRSLNLSNSVAIILYEALRQTGLPE